MDIATFWNAGESRGDWALPTADAYLRTPGGGVVIGADGFAVPASGNTDGGNAGLRSGHDLATAVLISLFTDAAAGPDDTIPDASANPRGWWGDDAIGSKLWLLARAKRTPQTLLLAIAYIRQALAWLVTDGVAADVAVSAEWQAGGRLAGAVSVTRADGAVATVPFDYAWKDLA